MFFSNSYLLIFTLMRCHFWAKVTKRSCLPSWISLMLSLAHSEGSHLPCYKLPFEAAHMARNQFHYASRRDLRLSNSHVSELENRSSEACLTAMRMSLEADFPPAESWRLSHSWSFDCILVRDPEPETLS